MQGFYTGSKSNSSLIHAFKKHVSSLIKARIRVLSNFWDSMGHRYVLYVCLDKNGTSLGNAKELNTLCTLLQPIPTPS